MGSPGYRGRLAPTPTGYLHLGHARTFRVAWQRCRAADGTLVYREEDLDPLRCRAEYAIAAREDLRWLGLDWDEGPDAGGPHAPYVQSEREALFLAAWHRLHADGAIYPCARSRREIRERAGPPVDPDEQEAEPLFPREWRPAPDAGRGAASPAGVNWRYRVPDGRCVRFEDGNLGTASFTAGVDFGDFLVWRKDGWPSYELAVVVDDAAMRITEVVRGADLLRSTARQLLLYEALGCPAPAFFHVELMRDAGGRRLAKRHDSLGIRTLREQGLSPEAVVRRAFAEDRGSAP